jgi:hypothetical protein
VWSYNSREQKCSFAVKSNFSLSSFEHVCKQETVPVLLYFVLIVKSGQTVIAALHEKDEEEVAFIIQASARIFKGVIFSLKTS